MAATYIARKAVELDLVPGRSPISVAAAAIYMASQASAEKKTQKGKRLWTGVRQQVDFSRHFKVLINASKEGDKKAVKKNALASFLVYL